MREISGIWAKTCQHGHRSASIISQWHALVRLGKCEIWWISASVFLPPKETLVYEPEQLGGGDNGNTLRTKVAWKSASSCHLKKGSMDPRLQILHFSHDTFRMDHPLLEQLAYWGQVREIETVWPTCMSPLGRPSPAQFRFHC
jgi:hypothetical protein